MRRIAGWMVAVGLATAMLLVPSAATAQLFNAIVGSGMGENDSITALQLLEKMSTPE